MEFFTFISRYLILDCNVELVRWVLAAPIGLHHSVNKLLNAGDLLVGFVLIELATSPNEDLVLIVLMAWNVELRFDAEDQECILLQVINVKHSHRLIPIWECEEPGFQLLLLSNHVTVVLHLVHDRLLLLEIQTLKVKQDPVPLSNTSIELVCWRLVRILEEEAPKLRIFTSLLNADDLLICSLMLLQELDVLSRLCDVGQKAALWHISTLPDINWLI